MSPPLSPENAVLYFLQPGPGALVLTFHTIVISVSIPAPSSLLFLSLFPPFHLISSLFIHSLLFYRLVALQIQYISSLWVLSPHTAHSMLNWARTHSFSKIAPVGLCLSFRSQPLSFSVALHHPKSSEFGPCHSLSVYMHITLLPYLQRFPSTKDRPIEWQFSVHIEEKNITWGPARVWAFERPTPTSSTMRGHHAVIPAYKLCDPKRPSGRILTISFSYSDPVVWGPSIRDNKNELNTEWLLGIMQCPRDLSA